MRVTVPSFARTIALGLGLGLAWACLPGAASADSYCDALQAQLNAASGGGMGQGQRSVLMGEYREAQFAARQFGCEGFGGFFMRQHPVCPAIRGRMNQLRRQLSGGGGDFSGNPFERQRIVNAMRRYGCGGRQFGQQFEMATGGGHRTLCVRTCDGYFFPISFSASRSRFKIDEAVCKAMYPEGAASLFVVSSAGDATRAVSLKGEPYAEQSFPVDHRTTFDPSCKAQLTEGLQSLHQRYEAALSEKLAAKGGKKPGKKQRRNMIDPPFPAARPAVGEDPETLADRAGGFAFPDPSTEPLLADLSPGRTVRVIGDDFFVALPSEEEAAAMSKARTRLKPLGPNTEPVKAGVLPGSGLRGSLETTEPQTIGLP